jgi:hypothetical protein
MNDMNVREPVPLQPAVVPAAYEDGLLKTADLNAPIAVQMKVWVGAQTGYTVRLDLDGVPATDERVLTDGDKLGDILTLDLPESFLVNEGLHTLEYRICNPITGDEVFSPSIPLIVDRTPPGAALLAPMMFPSASFGTRATAMVPAYFGMAVGDMIQTRCNGVPGPVHTVVAEELSVTPIQIAFEEDFLQSLAAPEVVIDYSVTDRAGNESIRAVPVTLSLVP